MKCWNPRPLLFTLTILSALSILNACGDSPFLKKEDHRQDPTLGSQLLQGALSLPDGRYSFYPKWRSGPHVGNESQLQIVVTDSHDRPIDIKESFALMLWMPTMGHGSFPVKLERVGIGLYEAREIFFTMPGYWDIHFQVTIENQIQEVLWGFTL